MACRFRDEHTQINDMKSEDESRAINNIVLIYCRLLQMKVCEQLFGSV
jgi:hypothetical protein